MHDKKATGLFKIYPWKKFSVSSLPSIFRLSPIFHFFLTFITTRNHVIVLSIFTLLLTSPKGLLCPCFSHTVLIVPHYCLFFLRGFGFLAFAIFPSVSILSTVHTIPNCLHFPGHPERTSLLIQSFRVCVTKAENPQRARGLLNDNINFAPLTWIGCPRNSFKHCLQAVDTVLSEQWNLQLFFCSRSDSLTSRTSVSKPFTERTFVYLRTEYTDASREGLSNRRYYQS